MRICWVGSKIEDLSLNECSVHMVGLVYVCDFLMRCLNLLHS